MPVAQCCRQSLSAGVHPCVLVRDAGMSSLVRLFEGGHGEGTFPSGSGHGRAVEGARVRASTGGTCWGKQAEQRALGRRQEGAAPVGSFSHTRLGPKQHSRLPAHSKNAELHRTFSDPNQTLELASWSRIGGFWEVGGLPNRPLVAVLIKRFVVWYLEIGVYEGF